MNKWVKLFIIVLAAAALGFTLTVALKAAVLLIK